MTKPTHFSLERRQNQGSGGGERPMGSTGRAEGADPAKLSPPSSFLDSTHCLSPRLHSGVSRRDKAASKWLHHLQRRFARRFAAQLPRNERGLITCKERLDVGGNDNGGEDSLVLTNCRPSPLSTGVYVVDLGQFSSLDVDSAS